MRGNRRIPSDPLCALQVPVTRRRAVAALAAGGLALAAGVAGCGCSVSSDGPTISDVDKIPVWESPYDWNAVMTNTFNRKYYYPDNVLGSRFGIDVSDHDGLIDWAAVAGDGVEFVFVRVGYRGYTQGGLMDDEYFESNYEGARANGIPCGAYMFSSAVTELEAREEAEYAINRLAGRTLDYPLVFDQEKVESSDGRANSLTGAQYTANALAFCDRVAAAGYQPMIYGNQHQLKLLDLDALADYPVWYAEYDAAQPTGKFDFEIWQYGAFGGVAGIEGVVDFNIQFLTEGE